MSDIQSTTTTTKYTIDQPAVFAAVSLEKHDFWTVAAFPGGWQRLGEAETKKETEINKCRKNKIII